MGRWGKKKTTQMTSVILIFIGIIYLVVTHPNQVIASESDNNELYQPQIMQYDERYIYTTKVRDQAVIIDTNPGLHIETVLGPADKLLLLDSYLILVQDSLSNYLTLQDQDISERRCSILTIYDIKDKTAPKILRKIEVEGGLESIELSKKDRRIHFVTTIGDVGKIDAIKKKEDFLPAYKDSALGQKARLLSFDKIYNASKPFNIQSSVSVIGSFGLEENTELSILAVVGYNQQTLTTAGEIFISTIKDYKRYISKIELINNKLQYMGSKALPYEQFDDINIAYIDNTLFVGSSSEQKEQVTCQIVALDKQMKVLGKYAFKVDGEEISDISFKEKKAYVTNRDKVLAVIDLSTPHRLTKSKDVDLPEIKYDLHPIAKNLAIEIGHVVTLTEEKGEWGATYSYYGPSSAYIKLFDTSNQPPKKLDEVAIGLQSTAVYAPYTAVVSGEKQIVAVPSFDILDYKEKVYVFQLQGNKIVEKGQLKQVKTYQWIYYTSTENYVFCIGDKLYYAYNNEISEYELKDLKHIENLVIEVE